MKLVDNSVFVPEIVPLQRQRSTLLSFCKTASRIISLRMEDRSGKMRLIGSWFVIVIHSASISTSKIACIQWQVISDQFGWRLAAKISMHSTGKGYGIPLIHGRSEVGYGPQMRKENS